MAFQPQNNTVFSTMKPFPLAVPYSMVQWLARFLAIGKPPEAIDDWDLNNLSTDGFAILPGSSTIKLAIILIL